VKKETGGTRLNCDPEEVMEHTKILHSELLLKRGDDTPEE